MDLSFPEGSNMNDGIDLTLCSLEYVTVDVVAKVVVELSRGAFLSKVDIRSAYLPNDTCSSRRQVPARHVLGGKVIRGHGSAFRFEVGSQNFSTMLWNGLRGPTEYNIFSTILMIFYWCRSHRLMQGFSNLAPYFAFLTPSGCPLQRKSWRVQAR